MAHVHEHEHDPNSYSVEQLCTIGICGALGGVAIMLWWHNLLRLMLAPWFFIPVLLGGIALLALVAVRAVTVWFTVGERHASHVHPHDHEHAHDHHHHHEHCGHDHSHEHAITTEPQGHVPLAVHGHDHHHEHEHGLP